jgi:prevent-host-death family protein
MITITASELRQHLFNYLKQVAEGETVVVKRNRREVARIIPATQGTDWRQQMKITPEIKVSAEELIKPIPDIWEDYT